MTFTGQKGTIYDLSAHYAYQYATTTVEEAANSILSLGNVGMSHRSIYLRFELQDADTEDRLHPSELVISATNGDIVLTMDEEGNATTGDLIVSTEKDTGEYPGEIFVSLLNANNTSVTYRLKATVGTDTYVGPVDRELAFNPRDYIGVLNRVARTMRKTTPATTLTVADIPSRVFTGSAYEPAVTVTDGEDALTLNTDYSVSYADNTNVGEATVTVKGLADAGAVAETKYLGTQDKTFNIVKATPVIEMDASTMTLVNNTDASQNTQTRTVTRVFIDNNGNGTWDDGTDYDITALCTVTYSTDDDAVATVNATTGQVTAAGPTTCTITATVAGADNWTSKTATYTVNVEQEVNGGNSVNPWTSGGEPEDDKIYVE